jgi:hypothetical protein
VFKIKLNPLDITTFRAVSVFVSYIFKYFFYQINFRGFVVSFAKHKTLLCPVISNMDSENPLLREILSPQHLAAFNSAHSEIA